MKIFTQFIILVQALFLTSLATGQGIDQQGDHGHYEKCGINHFTEQLHRDFPGAEAAARIADSELDEFTQSFIESAARGDEPIIIPVVFHIVHFGGSENISFAQIQSQMDVLNEDFSASTPGLTGINPAFSDIIGNVGFEFRLAQKDPDGNCTNGIVRVVSDETLNADDGVKSVSPAWPRNKYMNVWVVRTIGGSGNGTILGYTRRPGQVNSPVFADIDGIVIRSDYTGRIGTAAGNEPSTLTHEIGHWANLAHTWGNTNNSGLPSNCNTDDGISDTPNTTGWSSFCDINGTTCGSLDNVQNFMDYAGCAINFTQGQANVMNAAMNSFVAQRNSLWTQSNLEDTGVLDAPTICQADFEAPGASFVCVGGSLEFNDLSFNGVQSRSWVFEGGSPATSTEESPVVTYDTPGTYMVTLTVSNPNGSMSVEKDSYVTVVEPGQNSLQFTESFEAFSSLEPNDEFWTIENIDGSDVKWEIDNSVGYFSNQSVKVQGRSNSNTVSIETLISPTFDLTGLSQNAVLNFRYAHARRTPLSDDILRVYISRDCGETWSLRRTLDDNDLPTVSGNISGQFVPSSNDQWEEDGVPIIAGIFLTNEFKVKFEFESNQGNNIYIDYINLFDGLTSSLGEIDKLTDLTVYPNPSEGDFTLEYALSAQTELTVQVLDLSGRLLQEVYRGVKYAGAHFQRIDMQDYPQGMYMIKILGDGQAVTKRVVRI